MLEANDVVHRSDAAFDSPVHDELILVQTQTDAYFSLGESGKEIWEFLATPMTVDALCCRIASAHDMVKGDVEYDVIAFLTDLKEANLIRIEG